jgi:hypothetical protein
MTLKEASISLKLECALRQLGFLEVSWRVYAHAGIYMIYPVSHIVESHPYDNLLGFQLFEFRRDGHLPESGIQLGFPLLPSAKSALDFAIMHSS